MKLSELKTFEEVLADRMTDPDFREVWERTALARAVADQLIAYRAENGLTQVELGRLLCLRQPAIARLESGEHEPSFSTLTALSRKLRIAFHIAITPEDLTITANGAR